MARVVLLFTLLGYAAAIDNGLGLRPPMGWRSWNCYGGSVDQKKMEGIMDAMASKSRGTSLLELGYNDCGLDDNWQACKAGVNSSFHDADGNPLINKDRFPDMKAMTDYGHKLGMRVGWYMNNCICRENQFTDPGYITKHMERSAAAVAEYGFDAVKLDGCGEFRNLTWWAQLLNATGRHIMIENCHWGQTVPGDTKGDAPCTGTTMPSNCPYNFFRTSGDIRASWSSMWGNLQTTRKYQGEPPLARPGTWAYPDMLEVGNMASYNEDRAHFGAWCIVSSPLILGLDLLNATRVDRVWDVISNTEAIAVNQAWAGHPGKLLQDGAVQVWAKPITSKSVAFFAISNHEVSQSATVTFKPSDMGLSGTLNVRDIWGHKNLPTTDASSYTTDSIDGHDSRFYIFSEQ